MSIFSYLFENNHHQATFSTLPVVVRSCRLHENQIKVRFFGLEDWRVARNQNGAFICSRNLHQAQPRILHGLRLVWGGGLDYVWLPSPTLATSGRNPLAAVTLTYLFI